VMVLTFLTNGIAIQMGKRAPIPFALLLIPLFASLLLSVAQQGVIGMLWCFPGVLFCFFVLPRWMALGASAVLVVASTPLVYQAAGAGLALRFAVALLLTAVIVHTITEIMRTLQYELEDLAMTDPLTGALNRR